MAETENNTAADDRQHPIALAEQILDRIDRARHLLCASVAATALALTLTPASASDPLSDLPGELKSIEPVPYGAIIEGIASADDNVVSYEVDPTAASLIATGVFTYDDPPCMSVDERLASLGRPLVGFAGELVYDSGNFAAFILDGTTYGRWVILTTYNTGDTSCTTNITLVETAEQD